LALERKISIRERSCALDDRFRICTGRQGAELAAAFSVEPAPHEDFGGSR
jgi:hypothetical protein